MKQSGELFTEGFKGKSQAISQKQVLAAYKQVKSKGGAGGVDGLNFKEFETKRNDHLYKLWNRLASGSYFPQAVRQKRIPKYDGTWRSLGIPTLSDRTAQQVVKDILEPRLERVFHPNSFGYRPNKGGHQAIEQAQQNCWAYRWVIDMDIKGFFDNIDHDLLMKAVKHHVNDKDEKWMLLYIERWLKAPIQTEEGELVYPTKGTPQGGVISPVLANLFLHYVFDKWMDIHHKDVPFERYADDVIVHCKNEKQARYLLKTIRQRMEDCQLQLHPAKTKLVYCKQSNRRGKFPEVSFDFLGYQFKPRRTKTKDGRFRLGFTAAISRKSQKRITETVRKLKIHRATGYELTEIAELLAPKLRGWITYYGKYSLWELDGILQRVNDRLVRWVMGKYKRFRRRKQEAREYLRGIAQDFPNLFVHWKYGFTP